MRIISRIAFVSFLLTCALCSAVDLTVRESEVLNQFFRLMVEESEAGYVLIGAKPVCMIGFPIQDEFLRESPEHLSSVVLREGSALLKSKQLKGQDILIHTYNKPDAEVKNYTHLLFINKHLFLDVVNKNIALFQYVLGPSITAESLLERLTDPEETFYQVLKSDKVLIGILLGFGTQNALHVARIEDLQEYWFSEAPPLSRRAAKLSHLPKGYRNMAFLNCRQRYDSSVQPSFGFASIDDEMRALIKKITCSSEKLQESRPHFIFGHLADPFSKELLVQLEDAQQKIQQLLSEETFLPRVLALTFPNETFTNQPSDAPTSGFNQEEQGYLSLLVASSMWDLMEDDSQEYITSMIQGMQLADQGKTPPPSSTHYGSYSKQHIFLKIKKNLEASEDSLSTLKSTPKVLKVANFPIYYTTLISGSGSGLNHASQPLVHYSLTYFDGQSIVDTFSKPEPETLNLNAIIPGLALGIIGMKVGEEREILIHPSLAYGIYTALKKGVLIKAKVHLVGISEIPASEEFDLSKVEVQDLNQELAELKILNPEELLALSKSAGLTYGYQTWQHYQKSPLYSLKDVMGKIQDFVTGKAAPVPISGEALSLISRLHFMLYAKSLQDLRFDGGEGLSVPKV